MDILLDEPNTKVILFAEGPYIEIRIQGEVLPADYQFAYEHALSCAEQGQVKKFLVNEVKAKVEGKSRLWLLGVFVPKVVARIGVHVEVVIARKGNKKFTISRAMIEKLIRKLKEKFNLQEVEDEEQGRQLLLKEYHKKKEE